MDIVKPQQKHTKEFLRDQLMKWREERQARLAARVLHNRQAKVSSAVFGTVSSSDVTTRSADMNLPSSAAHVPKSKSGQNPKIRPKSAPKIKHTIASKLRLIKGNPLLEARGLITMPTKRKKPENNASNDLIGRNIGQLNTLSSSTAEGSSLQHRVSSKPFISLKKKITSADSIAKARQDSRVKPLPIKRNGSVRRSLSVGPPVRRSLAKEVSDAMNIRRVQSVADIQDLKDTVLKEDSEALDGVYLPLPCTPKSYKTPRKDRSELFFKSVERRELLSRSSSVYMPTPEVMRKRLSDWLHKRGKSIENFHHLRCFGLHASNLTHGTASSRQNCKPERINYKKNKQEEVQKDHTSNIEPSALMPITEQETFSNQEAACSSLAEENKENVCVGNSHLIVEGAVTDLLNIILIGYPWDQCEEWLTMIRKSCPGIKEVPIYWECLAALEETRGDFKSAVDCYERAIIRGASPTKIGESLDQLMEKFNMLNLNCGLGNDKGNSSKTPRKQVVDACNIFKSSIIKFALQQKVLRRLGTNLGVEASSLHYVVTPVRRSTRSSLSHYRSTPGVLCLNSLNQLESGIRKSMVFQPNCALDP